MSKSLTFACGNRAGKVLCGNVFSNSIRKPSLLPHPMPYKPFQVDNLNTNLDPLNGLQGHFSATGGILELTHPGANSNGEYGRGVGVSGDMVLIIPKGRNTRQNVNISFDLPNKGKGVEFRSSIQGGKMITNKTETPVPLIFIDRFYESTPEGGIKEDLRDSTEDFWLDWYIAKIHFDIGLGFTPYPPHFTTGSITARIVATL